MGQSGSAGESRPTISRPSSTQIRIEALPHALTTEDSRVDLSLPGQAEPPSQNDFNIIKVIGKGSFGKVLLVSKKDTGQLYAMKVLKKDALIKRNQVQHTKAERRILRTCDSPFIVRMHFAFQSADKLYLVLDYLPGGELFYHLKRERRFEEERVRLYSAELVLALEHLHVRDIVYRDLKPENVLLDSGGHVCLTDFGLSKEAVATGGRTKTFCGTPEYIAPEILQGLGHGKPVDWWSLGTLVYEMLVGLPPFYSTDVNTMYEKILRGELTFPSYVSPDARTLLAALLQRSPDLRLGSGLGDAEQLKSHAWFSGMDWGRVARKEYAPVYQPTLAGFGDTSHFDQAFTELPVESLPDGSGEPAATPKAAPAMPVFEGFSWEGRSQ
jgi:serum/glucocorticoid-regulated kinase 2